MKVPTSLSRVFSSILWLIGIFVITISLNELLHRSKQPEIFFWSYKKFFVCLGLVGVSIIAFWGSLKLRIPGLPHWLESYRAPYVLFLSLTSLWFVINYSQPTDVGGDLEYQMIGFHQYLKGEVDQFNAQKVPIVDGDLSKDRIEHIVWYPPGPLYVLYPLVKMGLSPELAARWMVFIGFLLGGCGFLALARYLGFQHSTCLAFALVLSLSTISRDGLGIISPTSADNLGFAIFPWLSLWTLKLLKSLNSESRLRDHFLPFLVLGIATGGLFVVKYSWFVAGASLAFFLGISLFLFVRKLRFSRRVALMVTYSIFFFIPFLWLNHHNSKVSGVDALDYNQKGSLGDNAFIEMVYGPNFSSTARPQELPFSLASGPGFLLGGNLLATRFVHFLRQDIRFSRFFQESLNTNAHVWALILLCAPFSIMVIWLLYSHVVISDPLKGMFLLTMVLVPLFLLGYLSLKSGFNYIVKDNYRYVIPYSFIVQVLLLNYWFRIWKQSPAIIWRGAGMIVIFWVCIFPGTWKLKAEVIQLENQQSLNTPSVPTESLMSLTTVNHQSITFFLNGNGSRTLGIVPREVHISFILNGGFYSENKYFATDPVRVVIAVEGNLDVERSDIQEFFQRFPNVQWVEHNAPGSLYPNLFVGEMFSPAVEALKS